MRSEGKHGGLIFFIITAFTLLSFISAFADTTTYQYDDNARKVRIERGTPGVTPPPPPPPVLTKSITLRRYSPTDPAKGDVNNPWVVNEMTTIEATLVLIEPTTVFTYYRAKKGSTDPAPVTGTMYELGATCTSTLTAYLGFVCKLESAWLEPDLCEFGAGKYEQYDKLELASDTSVSGTTDDWWSDCGSVPTTYTLSVTVAGTGTGTVTSNPAGINCGTDCTEAYDSGTTVTLTAIPSGGSVFTGWSGACSGTGASCTVQVDSTESVTATFDIKYNLVVIKMGTGTGTVTSNPAGINCGPDCVEAYDSGANVTLTATPSGGSVFTGWSGACTGTGISCTVAMDAAKSVIATFNSNYSLSVTMAGTGTGTVNINPPGVSCGTSCATGYTEPTTVTLTATPSSSEYIFAGWSGACTGTTCTLLVDSPKSVTATFSPQPITLYVTMAGTSTGAVNINPPGKDCTTSCSKGYVTATDVTLTATPSPGAEFIGWSGACTGTGTCTLFMDTAKSVTATFDIEIPNYNLTVTKSGTGSGTVTSNPSGIDCGTDCAENYNAGAIVTLTATPAAGSTFAGWSGACTGTGTCMVTMSQAKSVNAAFNSGLVQYALTVTKTGTGSGTISSSPAGIYCGTDCAENYNAGTAVTLTANPAAGSSFSGWTGDCVVGATPTKCTTIMNNLKTITATFRK